MLQTLDAFQKKIEEKQITIPDNTMMKDFLYLELSYKVGAVLRVMQKSIISNLRFSPAFKKELSSVLYDLLCTHAALATELKFQMSKGCSNNIEAFQKSLNFKGAFLLRYTFYLSYNAGQFGHMYKTGKPNANTIYTNMTLNLRLLTAIASVCGLRLVEIINGKKKRKQKVKKVEGENVAKVDVKKVGREDRPS